MHKGYCKDVGTSLKKIINYFIEFYKGGCSICKWGYYQPRKFLIDDQKKLFILSCIKWQIHQLKQVF